MNCTPGRHFGPFKFGQVIGWVTCECGTDIEARNIESNHRATLLPYRPIGLNHTSKIFHGRGVSAGIVKMDGV